MGAGDAHVVPEAHFGEEMREERQLQFFVPVARLKENPFEKLLGIRRSSCGSKNSSALGQGKRGSCCSLRIFKEVACLGAW
jgi:hypothetical protein